MNYFTLQLALELELLPPNAAVLCVTYATAPPTGALGSCRGPVTHPARPCPLEHKWHFYATRAKINRA